MPDDTDNGMASTILTNLEPGATQSTIAFVISEEKPRIEHLKSTLAGQRPFTLAGRSVTESIGLYMWSWGALRK